MLLFCKKKKQNFLAENFLGFSSSLHDFPVLWCDVSKQPRIKAYFRSTLLAKIECDKIFYLSYTVEATHFDMLMVSTRFM